MAGYANRIITEHFPELSEPGEDIFVVFRNPKTQTMSRFEMDAVAKEADGSPNSAEATAAVYQLMSRLIIGGHLYDARVDGVDEHGNLTDQPLLTYPLSPEAASGLPLEIITKISRHIQEAQNPQ
jgi:hypothetical protein